MDSARKAICWLSASFLAFVASLPNSSASTLDPILWGSTGQLYPLDIATGALGPSIAFSGPTPFSATDLAGDATTQASLLWGVTFNFTNQLRAYSPLTAELLSTKAIVAPETISTLAIDPATGFFYGTSGTSLYRLAPDTGVATLIGATTLSVDKGLGFDNLGNLYGVGNQNQLSAINKTTGAASLIATLGLHRMEDIAVHPQTGVMYGLGYGFGTDNYSLYQINLADGALTRLGLSVTRPSGLAFTAVPEPAAALIATLGAIAVLLKTPRRSR